MTASHLTSNLSCPSFPLSPCFSPYSWTEPPIFRFLWFLQIPSGLQLNPPFLDKPIVLRSNPLIDHYFPHEKIAVFTAMTDQGGPFKTRTAIGQTQPLIYCFTLHLTSPFTISPGYPQGIYKIPPIFLVKIPRKTDNSDAKGHTTHSVVVISDATEAASARALRTTRVGSCRASQGTQRISRCK